MGRVSPHPPLLMRRILLALQVVGAREDSTTFVELDREDVLLETSDESFDRLAFAAHALSVLRPPRTAVALCRGIARVRVEQGREWNPLRAASHPRWAIMSVPPKASRRAIAIAVASLAGAAREPFALDALLAVEPPR